MGCFFFSSRRRHTRWTGDWSSDVCSSDLFPKRLVAIGGVHLVSELAALAETCRRSDRISEGSVKPRSVLRRISHDACMDELFFLQRGPDAADAAVHHVRE